MLGRRLTQLITLMGLANGCGSDANRAPGDHITDTPGATASAAGVTTAGSGTAGSGTSSGSGGGASEAGASGGSGGARASDAGADTQATTDSGQAERRVPPLDDASDPPIDDAPAYRPCVGNRATLGSANLRAGGATPTAFAAAYNADLDALLGPGPMLVVLSGLNDPTPATWVASFGALDASGGTSGVRFAGRHADVAFTLGAAQSVVIAPTDAAFELKFSAPASDTLIPVGAIDLAGTLASGCGYLAVSKTRLLVPASAAAVAFHQSTIGALMGAATETYRGQSASAWPLELSGRANETYAPAAFDDAGAGP